MLNMKYTIEKEYLPPNTKRRPFIKNKGIKFIVAHDTGNDGSTALGNVSYYRNSANDMEASAHVFIDDKNIIECIPLDEKAWHVRYNVTTDNNLFGCDANDNAIGVELCYSFQKGKINNAEAYKRYVWYMAYLCCNYNLNPLFKIAGHEELDPARKVDPYTNALKKMGITKKKFLEDVADELEKFQIAQPEYAVYQGNHLLKELPSYKEAVAYAEKWANSNVRKISDGSWVWTNMSIDNQKGEDEIMKLEKWQKTLLIDGLKKLNNINGSDGKPLINSPNDWIKKVNEGTLTAGDLAIINFALIMRQVVA